MDALKNKIAANLTRVREGIADSAVRCGRDPASVRLLAVTKYSTMEQIRCLIELGCRDLAESRPQDLWEKAKQFETSEIRWHFIGHLQRNKVRRSLPLIHLMHSLDSLRLLQEICSEAKRVEKVFDALVEVNISGDQNKTGLLVSELPGLLEHAAGDSNVRICGLMGMAGLGASEDETRRSFALLRELREHMQSRFPQLPLADLSMGMSGDYPLAIAEGSTIVRIGSALFE